MASITYVTAPGRKAYTHTQALASAEWIINHNLGFRPNVQVISTGGIEVNADVVHMSVNQTRVYFSSPYAGTARLS